MDKLITTNNGGMPFDLDDIRWVEKGINDSFQAIGRALADSNTNVFVLWGCALSDGGTTWSLASGVIWARDEFWLVDAHTINKLTASGSYYLKQVITHDTTGSEIFESGSTVDTYQKRRLELTSSAIDGSPTATDVSNVNVLSLPTLRSQFADRGSVDTIDSAVATINTNRLRACTVYQQMNVGQSYSSWTDLTISYSTRFGDPSMFAQGSNLGISMDSYSVYKITVNTEMYTTDSVRIKNVPSGVLISAGGISRDASGNVDLNGNDPETFTIINNTVTAATLTFAVRFDGNLSIVIEKIG